MRKCKFTHCQYPECEDENCGLAAEAILEQLVEENRELRWKVDYLRSVLGGSLRNMSAQLQEAYIPDYTPTCPFECPDCVNDPAYIRTYSPQWWIELGRPTVCDVGMKAIAAGKDWCGCYDDEDK